MSFLQFVEFETVEHNQEEPIVMEPLSGSCEEVLLQYRQGVKKLSAELTNLSAQLFPTSKQLSSILAGCGYPDKFTIPEEENERRTKTITE
jgi:hypothetical protein